MSVSLERNNVIESWEIVFHFLKIAKTATQDSKVLFGSAPRASNYSEQITAVMKRSKIFWENFRALIEAEFWNEAPRDVI